MPKQTYPATSPFAKTPQTIWYLTQMVQREIPPHGTDRDYVIPDSYDLRPDNAAYALFGTAEYWWIFAMLNPNILIDPVNDFTAGKTIRIPTKERLREVL